MQPDWKEARLPGGIHAFTGGAGSTMVLLSGWPETAEAYSEVFPSFAKHFHVFAIDPPGLGESAAPDVYDTGSVAKLLSAAVPSAPDGIHLVGHDVGCWIAYAWAAQFPNQVRSLTLLDAAVPGLAPPQNFPLPSEVNQKLWQFSFNMLPDLPEILTAGRERELFDWLFTHKAQKLDRIPQANRDHYVDAYSRPGAMSRGFEYYRAVAKSASQNKEFGKAKLPMPVLALGGESGSGEGLKEFIGQYATHAEGGMIKDCGHYLMEEQPDVVAEQIMSFIRRAGARS